MQFALNNTMVEDQHIPADLTLLRYLREHKNLCGSKEGCASGDCGACTILVGSSDGHEIHYRAVNACIAPASIAAGKHIVTIEHLGNKQQLHPAQTAMVDYHGSQCGFCTPGIIMSLAAMHETTKHATSAVARETVCEAISGNLCRCTGYRPIIDAGMNLHKYAPINKAPINQEPENHADKTYTNSEADSSQLYQPELAAKLQTLNLPTINNGYYYPRSLVELNAALNNYSEAKIIAGGTDLMLKVTQEYQALPQLIDVCYIPEMSVCETSHYFADQAIRYLNLGAALPLSQLEENLATCFPHFVQFLQRFASRQIRNRATLGGNIANGSPIADTPPILLAMDAQLVIGKSDGSCRILPISQFYQGYKKTDLDKGEYLISVLIDEQNLRHFHQFYKVSKRVEDDISCVMLAVRLDIVDKKINSAHIAYGGMAATPIRITDAEQCLTGTTTDDEDSLNHALTILEQQLTPITDVRASAAYRKSTARNLFLKTWHLAQGHKMADLTHKELWHHA